MSSNPSSKMADLAARLTEAQIPFFLPSSPDFASSHALFVEPPLPPSDGDGDNSSQSQSSPLAVARPLDIAQVCTVVRACAATNTPVTVRSGGHDMMRRAVSPSALLIDVRSLDAVEVSPDRRSAVVGGGVSQGRLLAELEKGGLAAATGTVAGVGYVGWATLGGYGPGSTVWGMGVDQVLGATVVGADGVVREFGEGEEESGGEGGKEMLRAVRGAGGCVGGVIVRLRIRVYPLEEIQSGTLVYDSSDFPDIGTAFTSFLTKLDALLEADGPLPSNLYIMPAGYCLPDGMAIICGFIWHGRRDNPLFTKWLDRIANLGEKCVFPDPATQAIHSKTLKGFVDDVTATMPPSGHGGADSVCVSRYSPQVAEVLGRAVADFPVRAGRTLGGVNVHALSPRSPSVTTDADDTAAKKRNSVFRCRRGHFLLEILGVGTDAEAGAEALAWVRKWAKVLREEGGDAVLEESYVSLTDPTAVSLEKMYGRDELEWLTALKRKADPGNVFAAAVPNLKWPDR